MIRIAEIKAEETYPIRKSVLRESFMKASNAGFKGLQFQLRGMGSSIGSQGKGYGKALLTNAEQILKDRGVDLIWCNARVVALDFYSKLGYTSIGNLFEVDQVGPHFVMFKNLK